MFNPTAHFDKRLLDLKDSVFLNTFRRIDWDELISSLMLQQGVSVTTDPSRWDLNTPGYNEIFKIWKKANFNSAAIKWTNYYPEQHFDQKIVQDVADYLRLTGIHRAWISRVDPGYFAPWHWDVDDNENAYLEKGEIKRYSCFIKSPAHGQIFVIGNDYLYDCPQGAIIKWNNYKDWHSGINAGMTPKFMLHILGH